MKDNTPKVIRFTLAERLVHWLVALSFLYAALTGLSLWSPRLYWLASVFGGGVTVRGWHPLGGLLFVLVFSAMFVSWKRQMRLDSDDRRWLRMAHRYAAHDYAALPEAGRFNGGQKSLFWLQSVNGVLLLLSGIVLWWPESMARPLREAAVLVHPISGILAIAGLIVHIYMGTAATPGAFRGMAQGWVKPGWAASHHAKWYRETKR
ncbi:MAG TPA: formate dehydrogenase subunit gamma [Terriglobia bacterium]|nr:formate dehydrogenase subunit gamma [Terriglobia bacterium]